MTRACDIRGCAGSAEADAPVALCAAHLIEAHDWVAGEVGVSDLLPSPCLACGERAGIRYPSGWICARCEWRVGDIIEESVLVDVVYYIRQRERIKIGTSANPRSRLAALHYDEVLAFERGDRRVEQRRHAQFASRRIPRTEWFEVHDELLEHIAELAAGVGDPWQRHALWVSQELARRA